MITLCYPERRSTLRAQFLHFGIQLQCLLRIEKLISWTRQFDNHSIDILSQNSQNCECEQICVLIVLARRIAIDPIQHSIDYQQSLLVICMDHLFLEKMWLVSSWWSRLWWPRPLLSRPCWFYPMVVINNHQPRFLNKLEMGNYRSKPRFRMVI